MPRQQISFDVGDREEDIHDKAARAELDSMIDHKIPSIEAAVTADREKQRRLNSHASSMSNLVRCWLVSLLIFISMILVTLAISLAVMIAMPPRIPAVPEPAQQNGIQTQIKTRTPPIIPLDLKRFQHHTVLTTDAGDEVDFWWQVQGKMIEFGVAAENHGNWVAIGVSEHGGMKGADIFLAVIQDKNVVLEDRFAEGSIMPQLDSIQDLKLTSSFVNSTHVAFTFKRPILAKCSEQDSDILADFSQWFLVAIGSDLEFGYHGPQRRGLHYVDLTRNLVGTSIAEPNSINEEEETFMYNVTSSRITLNSNETSFCYSIQALPTDTIIHVIEEAPLLRSPLVHHAVMYLCNEARIPSEWLADPKKVHCEEVLNPPCPNNYFSVYVKGRKNQRYPKELAKPLGGRHASGLRQYAVLEIHYSNPEQKTAEVDPGSGFSFVSVKKPRKHAVGIFSLGPTVDVIDIPPGEAVAQMTSVCPKECLQKYIPSSGIHILSTTIHMHQRGVAAITKQVRNGKEVGVLSKVRYFDQNYQNSAKSNAIIYPNDTLVSTFEWDTSGDNQTIFGGVGAYSEMGFNFIEYYPRLPLTYCGEFPEESGVVVCQDETNPWASSLNYTKINVTYLSEPFQFKEKPRRHDIC